jgi:hypothetical protein
MAPSESSAWAMDRALGALDPAPFPHLSPSATGAAVVAINEEFVCRALSTQGLLREGRSSVFSNLISRTTECESKNFTTAAEVSMDACSAGPDDGPNRTLSRLRNTSWSKEALSFLVRAD